MKMLSKWYHPISKDVEKRASRIKLLICDIDGVFSDGKIYMGNQNEELKTFNTKDGFGIKALMKTGVEVAVITGRKSNIVTQRMKSLGVNLVYQNMEDKLVGYGELKHALGIEDSEVAYIGDDYPDIPVMQHCGLAVAVQDAHPYVKEISHYTTSLNGGYGAVRELTDIILAAQNGEEHLIKGFTGVSG